MSELKKAKMVLDARVRACVESYQYKTTKPKKLTTNAGRLKIHIAAADTKSKLDIVKGFVEAFEIDPKIGIPAKLF
jgi:hypothetical protein